MSVHACVCVCVCARVCVLLRLSGIWNQTLTCAVFTVVNNSPSRVVKASLILFNVLDCYQNCPPQCPEGNGTQTMLNERSVSIEDGLMEYFFFPFFSFQYWIGT